MDENEQLNELLSQGYLKERPANASLEPAQPSSSDHKRQDLDLCQWQVGPNEIFRPAAKTVPLLGAGAYTVHADDFGPYLKRKSLISDDIVKLPDSANIRVLDGIRKFWESRARYSAHGLIFKRGVLLWGPAGSGKTVTVQLLTQDLIQKGGIVIFCDNPKLTAFLVDCIRRIEKDRPLIVVYEDIDEIVSTHGEHMILSMGIIYLNTRGELNKCRVNLKR